MAWQVTQVNSGKTDWVPLYARASNTGDAEFSQLYPGVPAWMRESLWSWLNQRICNRRRSQRDQDYYLDPDVSKLRELERLCRVNMNWTGSGRDYTDRLKGMQGLRTALYAKEERFLTAVDLELSRCTDENEVNRLRTILTEAGSVWTVGRIDSRLSLIKRLDETVQRAAEDLISRGTRASRLLGDAWSHAFSMHPDPSSSYRCAVRAVEAAAGPVITPRDPRPSLGKMNAVLRDGMDKWKFSFTVDSQVEPKKVLLQMMQLLWTNEYSRHVDADPDVPLHVSQEEAESAIALALTLVNWYSSGAITEAP